MSVSSTRLSPQHSPFTLLYPLITTATPSSMMRLKWGRYTSCSATSSTLMSTRKRAFSIELQAKCFTRRHRVALHAASERCAHLTHVVGVLAVGLLCPAPGGVAQDVDAHAAVEGGADRPQLPADRVADPLFEVEVPGRAAGHAHREARRPVDDDAPRSVREREARESEPFDASRVERASVVAAGAEVREARPARRIAVETPELLVVGHLPDDLGRGHAVAPGRLAAASSAASWLDVPIAMSTWPGSIAVLAPGLVMNSTVRIADREDQRAGLIAHVGLADGDVGERGVRGDLELLEPQLHLTVVHHDVEELGHVGLHEERRHAGAADLLRIDDAVRRRHARASRRWSPPGREPR